MPFSPAPKQEVVFGTLSGSNFQVNGVNVTPKQDILYADKTTNKIYQYNGTSFVENGGGGGTDLGQFETTGTSPNFNITIPNITSYLQLKGKFFRILTTFPTSIGTNYTLNINNLSALPLTKFNTASAFPFSTLTGSIFNVSFNDSGTSPVFTLHDPGTSNPVEAGTVSQAIGGNKAFSGALQVVGASPRYFYTQVATRDTDTVGDLRITTSATGISLQNCTTANASKGAGTWANVSVTQTPSAQTSWASIYNRSFTTTISTTEVDLTALFGVATVNNQNNSQITYDSTKNAFVANPAINVFYKFNNQIRLSGSVAGGTGSQSVYRIILRRGDGTFISDYQYIKPQGASNTFNLETVIDFATRVLSGGSDPFQSLGFRISMIKVTGADLSLTGTQQLTIER